jgi:hypothetical protein
VFKLYAVVVEEMEERYRLGTYVTFERDAIGIIFPLNIAMVIGRAL